MRHAEARAHAAGFSHLTVRAIVNAAPLDAKLGNAAIREGAMATPTRVALPVVFMGKPA